MENPKTDAVSMFDDLDAAMQEAEEETNETTEEETTNEVGANISETENLEPTEVKEEESNIPSSVVSTNRGKKVKIIRSSPLFQALGLHSFAGQEVTLSEALKRAVQVTAAKCDLTANLWDATAGTHNDQTMRSTVTIYNTHSGEILAPMGVGRDYGIVQYHEATSFLERLIGGSHAELRCLSAPGTGSHLYVVLRAAGAIKIGGEEIMNDFLVTTSHDGTAKLKIRITPTIGKLTAVPFTQGVNFKHSKMAAEHIVAATDTISMVTDLWDTFEADVQKMMAVSITKDQAMDYFKMIVGDDEESTRQTNIRDTFASLYEKGTVARLVPNTMAAAYFTFVEWSNHHKTVRKMKNVSNGNEAELYSKFHGTSVKEQTEGYAFAVQMTNEFGGLGV